MNEKQIKKSKAGNKAGLDRKFRGVCGNDRRKPFEASAENNFQDFIQDVIGGKR
jgi:hypothetical protein